jgi:hypothetical protein
MCITASLPITTEQLINRSHQSVFLYVYPLTVATQRLGRNIVAASEHTHHFFIVIPFYLQPVPVDSTNCVRTRTVACGRVVSSAPL